MGNRKKLNEPKRMHSVQIKKFKDQEKTQTYYHKKWVKDIYYFISIDEMEQINPTEFKVYFSGGSEVLNENDNVFYIKKHKQGKNK
tara:strand:- start:1139 stop:1396 length:258 start_codon:yes stop_codon:yes gene_type:complete